MNSSYWYNEIERLKSKIRDLNTYKQDIVHLESIINYLAINLFEIGHKLVLIGSKFMDAYKESNKPLDLSTNIMSTGNSNISKSKKLEIVLKDIDA